MREMSGQLSFNRLRVLGRILELVLNNLVLIHQVVKSINDIDLLPHVHSISLELSSHISEDWIMVCRRFISNS